MQNLSVCFCNSSKTWGGGEKWHFENGFSLHNDTYKITYIVSKNSPLEQKVNEAGIPFYRVLQGNISVFNPGEYIKAYRTLKKINPDIIIFCLPRDLKIFGFAAMLLSVKKRIYRRGSAIPIKNSFINKVVFKYIITEIIANSEETKRAILKNNKSLFPAHLIHVLYNGIDVNSFSSQRKEKTKTDTVIIGTAGRIVEQKNHKVLIEIAQKLLIKTSNFHIIIAGEGALKESLQHEIDANGLHEFFTLPGFIPAIHDFFASIDIFVLPSTWEGFGYVIAEAMASGKPVIAFDISSNPELIRDGETGFLIPPFDSSLFAERLHFLIENQSIAKSFGEKGSSFVQKNFSFTVSYNKFKDLLHSK